VCLHETKRFKVRRGLSGPRGEHAQPASGQAYPKPASQFASAFSVLLMATLSGHCAHKHVQHVQGRKRKKMKAGPCISHVTKKNKKVRPCFPPHPTHMSRAQNKLLPNNATTSRVWHGRVGLISTSRPHRSSQFSVVLGFHCISAQRESIQILRLHRGQAPRNAWAASGTSTHACAVACISRPQFPRVKKKTHERTKGQAKHTRARTHAHTRTHP